MILLYKYMEVSSEIKIIDRHAAAGGVRPARNRLTGRRAASTARAPSNSDRNRPKSQDPDRSTVSCLHSGTRSGALHMTGNVAAATDTMMGRLEVAAEQQESELSMLRYLVWAIPSIGFIGTVRGIGLALRRADEALEVTFPGDVGARGRLQFHAGRPVYQHPAHAVDSPLAEHPGGPDSALTDLLPRTGDR